MPLLVKRFSYTPDANFCQEFPLHSCSISFIEKFFLYISHAGSG